MLFVSCAFHFGGYCLLLRGEAGFSGLSVCRRLVRSTCAASEMEDATALGFFAKNHFISNKSGRPRVTPAQSAGYGSPITPVSSSALRRQRLRKAPSLPGVILQQLACGYIGFSEQGAKYEVTFQYNQCWEIQMPFWKVSDIQQFSHDQATHD